MADTLKKSRWKRFLEFFNFTSIGQSTPLAKEYDNSALGKYSNLELKKLTSRFISSSQASTFSGSAVGDILPVQAMQPYLMELYNKNSTNKNIFKRLIALAPELGRANFILTSSILSPNDLQKNELNFECEIKELDNDDTIATSVNDLLKDHFNNHLKLHEKLPKWLSEILFESGAKTILCLPPQITDNMYDSLIPNSRIKHSSHESLQANISILMNQDIYTSNEFSVANEKLDILDDQISQDTLVNNIFHSIKDACISNEALKDSDIIDSPEILKPFTDAVLSSFIPNSENKDTLFHISTNLDVLNYSMESQTLMRTKFNNALIKKFKGDERVNRYIEQHQYLKEEPISSILDYCYKDKDLNKHYNKKIHPTLIELPTESVIPICIPGSVSQHLGYFILLDEFGYPLSVKDELNTSHYCKPGTVDASYKLLFGDACRNNQANKAIMEQIFDHVFSTITNHRLKSLGIENIKLIKYDDLNKVLFYRLLGKKKTNILFVPEILMMYFCFEYSDEGTGVAKSEHIKFALSVKTTLLMANMVAAMNAAVDHHRIEVNIDPKETNPEKIINDIREIYIANNLPVPSLNPWETANNVVRRSLQIVPKNLPGMSDFDVSVGSGEPRRGTTQVGTDIFDHINEMIKDGTGVPANALDKLPEEEYSRSVATNNILFARQLTEYQTITIAAINKLIRTYLSFDVYMQTQILNIIQKAPNIKDSNKFNMHKLIDNINLQLPSPQIAPDKSKFTEIKEFTDSIKDLVDMIYPDELDIESDPVKDGRRIMKAMFRQKVTLKLIEQLGFLELIKVEDLEKFDIGTYLDNQLELKNIAHAMYEWKDKFENIGVDKEDQDTGSEYSSSDESSGEEGGEEGGEDDMFGGMDLGGMEPEMEEAPEEEESSEETEEEPEE